VLMEKQLSMMDETSSWQRSHSTAPATENSPQPLQIVQARTKYLVHGLEHACAVSVPATAKLERTSVEKATCVSAGEG